MAVDEQLQTMRHSCAHVMAEAVLKLFPGTKIAIGPAIENGFYYDFDFPADHKASEADFPEIEKEMRRILAGNHDFERKVISKQEALELFKDQKQSPHTLRTVISTFAADRTLPTLKKSMHRASSSQKWQAHTGGEMSPALCSHAFTESHSQSRTISKITSLCLKKQTAAITASSARRWISSTSTTKIQARCSGSRMDGQCMSRSRTTCATRFRRTATSK